jgi:hypothetical protein
MIDSEHHVAVTRHPSATHTAHVHPRRRKSAAELLTGPALQNRKVFVPTVFAIVL